MSLVKIFIDGFIHGVTKKREQNLEMEKIANLHIRVKIQKYST